MNIFFVLTRKFNALYNTILKEIAAYKSYKGSFSIRIHSYTVLQTLKKKFNMYAYDEWA